MQTVTDTKGKILARASDLLQTRGFNGFSYRDISTELGIKNAAIHYHFPSKADLAVTLLENFRLELRQRTRSFMEDDDKPATPQLAAFFDYTMHEFRCDRCICPLGAMSVDYDQLPQAVRDAADHLVRDSLNWLTRVLTLGRQRGEFDFVGDPRGKAVTLMALLQGARQLGRIGGPDLVEGVIDQQRAEFGIAALTH